MKLVLRYGTTIFLDLIIFAFIGCFFVMGNWLNSIAYSFVYSLFNFKTSAHFYICFEIVLMFCISIISYACSSLASIMLYLDKFLIGSKNLDEPAKECKITRYLIILSGVVGYLLVCLLYSSTAEIIDSFEDGIRSFTFENLYHNLQTNVMFWKQASNKRIIFTVLSLFVNLVIFAICYGYRPLKIIVNKKRIVLNRREN